MIIEYSCLEDPWEGQGNITDDPQFCAWGSDTEVEVSSQAELLEALGGYSLSLSQHSPCIGTGKDNATMGASTGICSMP